MKKLENHFKIWEDNIFSDWIANPPTSVSSDPVSRLFPSSWGGRAKDQLRSVPGQDLKEDNRRQEKSKEKAKTAIWKGPPTL